jgi:pheromone receptor transcription factor
MPPRLSTNVDDSTLGGQIHSGDGNMGHNANGSNKRPRDEEDELDDDDEEEGGKKERTSFISNCSHVGRKIEIAFIKDKSRRHITFSKRKAGIMKKVFSPLRVANCRPTNYLS